MSFQVGDTIDVEIEKLTFNGGRGLARSEGFVVFVPFVLPGEKVKVQLTKVKKNFAESTLLKVIQASPLRVDPPCPVFQRCGGCSWQHIPYREQVRLKRKILDEMLKHFDSDISLQEFIPSKREYSYRNRIQLQSMNGSTYFRKRSGKHLVEFDQCLLADERINHFLQTNKQKWKNKQPERVEVALDLKGNVQEIRKEFKNEVRLFSQVNSDQNQVLIEKVLQHLADINPSEVFDLYCGSGNFSFPIQKKFKNTKITGVELSKTSIEIAKKQADSEPIRFVCASVESFLKNNTLSKNGIIIVDPPRTGLGSEVSKLLFTSDCHQIIYISCNPTTYFRDLRVAYDNNWKIKTISGLDMFPQTDHTEVFSVLTK